MKLGRGHIGKQLQCSIEGFCCPNGNDSQHNPQPPGCLNLESQTRDDDEHGRCPMDPGIVLSVQHQGDPTQGMTYASDPSIKGEVPGHGCESCWQ